MPDNPIRIFLVDDHAMVRVALARYLEQRDEFHVVGECGDALQVMKLLDDAHPDVVVLDISMPGLNGIDLCQEITKKHPNIAVVIVSMHSDDQFVARALKHGASGYVLKSSPPEHLAEALKTAHHGQLFLGPGIAKSAVDLLKKSSPDPHDELSARERQILQLVAEGNTNKQISDLLGISIKTVDTHRTRLMAKLNLHDRTAIVRYAVRKGVLNLDRIP